MGDHQRTAESLIMPDETPGDEREPERRDAGPAREPLRELTLGRSRPSPEPPGPARVDPPPRRTTTWRRSRPAAGRRRKRPAGRRNASAASVSGPSTRTRTHRPTRRWPSGPSGSPTPSTGLDCRRTPRGRPTSRCWTRWAGASRRSPRRCGSCRAIGTACRGPRSGRCPLLAEAQSALRRSLQRLQAPDDPDQLAAYEWVRETAARHRIFLKRFMRADDLADPAPLARPARPHRGPGRGRSAVAAAEVARSTASDPISGGLGRGRGTEEAWRAVIEAVEEMVGEGVPPSDRELRDLLLPSSTTSPTGTTCRPASGSSCGRSTATWRPARPRSAAAIAPEPTAEVREAARLLAGPERRADRRRPPPGGPGGRLKAALGLKDLIWIETKEHQSIGAFEAAIARPDVALVLLAIRWSSHAFGDVKQFCDRHGKPLVRLPGGYNPNQVAAQILSQCSEQLRDDEPSPRYRATTGRSASSWHRTSP